MNKIKIFCSVCNKTANREAKEVTRSKKLGRKLYCSLTCSGKISHKHLRKYRTYGLTPKNKGKDLTTLFSPLIKLLHRIRTRISGSKKYNINLSYVVSLWNSQRKVCPYTGWDLVMHSPSKNSPKKELLINQISIDRINSERGYVKGNIQLVSLIANYAKHIFKEEELLYFCKAVAKYQKRELKFKYKHSFKSFSVFIKLAKQRSKSKKIEDDSYYKNLTVEYLQELWIKQKGVCPYTGWKLDLPQTSSSWNYYKHHIKRASLDRIDNSKGYIPGNVQFVCVMYNYAKSNFTDQDVQKFCKAVYNYRLR